VAPAVASVRLRSIDMAAMASDDMVVMDIGMACVEVTPTTVATAGGDFTSKGLRPLFRIDSGFRFPGLPWGGRE
jgi:hypothetical protein